MMAYLLGKGGRSATTNAERDEAFADPENVRWGVRKFRERRGEKKFYDFVVARLIQEQATRVFQRGDTVRMHVEKGEEYVGQILSIFEVLKEDGTQGSDASTIMVELKWMYRPKIDISHTEWKRAKIPQPEADELYWSDHVDSSPAESILGIAHMRQTRWGVSRTRENPPKNFWKETDKVYLCRAFYNSSEEEKPKWLRMLEREELIYLLQNPDKKDLFNDGACFRRLGPDVLRKDEEGDYLYSESKPVIMEQAQNGTKKEKKEVGTHRRVFRCTCNVHQEYEELQAQTSSPRKRARRLDDDEDDEVPMMEDEVGDDVSNRDVEPGMVVCSIQGVQSVEVEFENDSEQHDDELTRVPRRRRREDIDVEGSAGGKDENASQEARPKRRRVEIVEAQGAAPGSIAAKRMQARQERERKAEAKANGNGVKKEEDIEELEELDMDPPKGENEEEDRSETALTGVMHSQDKEEDEEVKVEDTVEKAWNDVGNNYGVGQH